MTADSALSLDPAVVAALQDRLPVAAERTVASLTAEVDEYTGALAGPMGGTIQRSVQLALTAFLQLASGDDAGAQGLQAALDGAYALGRGEARSGRTMDALLAAYRVGARVSWREWSAVAVAHGLTADRVAQFAELVFAYIDELSAASAAGHRDELDTTGRVRDQYRERLARALLDGADLEPLTAAAERADWAPPALLTAVLLPAAQLRTAVAVLPAATLTLTDDPAVLLVPDLAAADILRALRGRPGAVVGPRGPWHTVAASHQRAVRARALGLAGDTAEHLTALVLGADPAALADLRSQVLAPLAAVRPAVAARLVDTLRCWLLHHGRRDDVAAALHVHPQTVRYRMTQLRDLFGAALTDPPQVLALTVALGADPTTR